MPRSSSVLDGGRFGDEALRVQNLLQYIPRSRITQPNADSDCRIQTGHSQLLQVAETLSRLIRDADRCMNTNSPSTRSNFVGTLIFRPDDCGFQGLNRML